MKKKNNFIQRLATYLSLNNEKTAEERLQQFINDQKHQTLLDRIKAIRNNSNYEPDYNKPKVHTDIVILYQINSANSYFPEFVPIDSRTRLTQQRPAEFENDMGKWLDAIKEEPTREKEIKKAKEEAITKFWEERITNVNKFMRHFTQIN